MQCNMADNDTSSYSIAQKTIKTLSKRSRKRTRVKRLSKNKSRRIRRKNSKVRFLEYLKNVRLNKQLCDKVTVCRITDMSMQSEKYEKGIKDVTDWQYQHQLAYWRSRAISLEYENRMLHQHLRDKYAKDIEIYLEQCNLEQEVEEETQYITDKNSKSETRNELNFSERISKMLAPNVNTEKEKEENRKLYGDLAPKIMGKETAVQLNFDHLIDNCKPVYWPNMPLKL